MAINEVLEKEEDGETLKALQNPAACMVDVQPNNSERYQVTLLQSKRDKTARACAQVCFLYPCDICKITWIKSKVVYMYVTQCLSNTSSNG